MNGWGDKTNTQWWFNAYREIISTYNITPENIYNMDESGFSIRTMEST
jgi:hypothetical protein